MSRQPRSTCRSCLYPSAMSSAGSLGSEERSRYFPSRFSSVFILALSMRSRPPGVTRRNRFSPGMVEIFPAEFRAPGCGQLVRPCDHFFELGDEFCPGCGVAGGGIGVVADDEPVAGVVDPYFLDLQIIGHGLVAALAGQSGFAVGGSGARFRG